MTQVISPSELSSLDSSTPLYGVIGYPVAHSLSPSMQLAAFEACHLPARYLCVEIAPDDLTAAIQHMKQLPFSGWNCTIPHKLELAGLVDELAESARQLGGVNTVLNDNGKLIGFNTDGQGWVRAIRESFSLDVRDLRILILGIGGAGQAIARQAALERCERLVLINRDAQKAHDLAETLTPYFQGTRLLGAEDRLKALPWDEDLIAYELNTIDLVVNASSLGHKTSDPSALSPRILQPHLCIYDTIYRPTKLIDSARSVGARCANGLSMLLHQGALSFEIWTGQPAPLESMRSALLKAAHPAP